MNVSESFLGPGLRRGTQEGKAIIQVASLFNQLLQHFPRTEFKALVKKNDAEKGRQRLRLLDAVGLDAVLPTRSADSSARFRNGLGCCLGKLVHLSIAKAPNKSTLSYANEHRPAQLYEDLFYTALNRFRDEEGLGQRKKKFRFEASCLLNSTTLSVGLKLFAWAMCRRA